MSEKIDMKFKKHVGRASIYMINPTFKQRLMVLSINFLMWYAWVLYRNDPEKYFEEVRELTIIFHGWIKKN